MQESWTLTLSDSGTPNSASVQETLADHEKDLGIFLSYYFKQEGAVAEKVKLASDINFKNETAGDFILDFDLVHFNACLAIHETKRDQMKITFEIENSKLHLKGPYWPQRGMDEI